VFLESSSRQLAYATIVFLVVLILHRLLPPVSPKLRYALWGLVLLRLVLPPDLSAPWGLSNLVSVSPKEAAHMTRPFDEPYSTALELQNIAKPSVRQGPQAFHILLLWLIGAVIALLHTIRQRLGHARQLEIQVQDPQILTRLEFWRRRFGIRRPVQLFTGEAAVSPFTLGSFYPQIFVPQALLEPKRSETLDAVLAHELVHVQRWDDLALMIEHLLTSAYFFFPPALHAAARRSVEREALCDEAVVAAGISRSAYARALVEAVQINLGGDVAVATFIQPRSTLKMRLRTILDSPTLRNTTSLPASAALFLGVLLLPMAAVPSSLAEAEPADPEPTKAAVEAPLPTLLHPLPQARLTAKFGPWKHPIQREKVHHNGIDLAAEEGNEIVAPLDGVVSRARLVSEDDDGFGTILEIDHGQGLTTSYYHLGELRAEAGQQVERGQVIATVGLTGQTTGPHLHFEVRLHGELMDPQELLSR
jgi:bla regulator protein BlaR1